MTRKMIDCRAVPNDVGCTLAITGEPGELITAATQHAVTAHGHADTPELRDQLRAVLADEPTVSQPGAFVQLIEFDTDRIAEWEAIGNRWAAAIGTQRTVRWSLLGADRDRPGRQHNADGDGHRNRSQRNGARHHRRRRSGACRVYAGFRHQPERHQSH